MDSPPPIKKRITISRWGPALTTEEKAANVQAQQPLPNGTGTDNKETSDKVVCHIIKLNKTPNHKDKEKKPAEPVDTQNESSAIEDNVEKSPNDSSSSSDSSDFFGFDTCDLGKKEAFLRVLSKFRKSIEEDDDDDDQKDDVEEPVDETKPSTAEEKERIEKAESENLSQEENQSNEMTVDTRPEEEDEMDTSVDKSNSERMDVDEHQDTDPMTKDSEAVRSEEGTPEKGVDTPESDPVLDNENKDKDVDNMESISIKEEVLSITDDGKDMDDKLSETHMGSESSLVDSQQENDPLADSFNSQDTSVLNGTQQTSGKKRSGRESQRLKKPVVDVSNPVYLKPFDFGWKRELVYRSTSDSSVSSLKRQADVYYYTPKGKKVRSFREVVEHLVGQDLNIDNFTFFKEAIGVEDPEKEIIRDAKLKLSKDLNSSAPSPILKKTLTPKVSKVAKTPKTPKNTPSTSQEPVEDTPNASPNATPPPSTTKGVTPRVVFRGKSKLTAGTKFTATQSKTTVPGQAQKIIISKVNKKTKAKSDDEMELGMLPPLWQPTEKVSKKETSHAKKSPSTGGKPMEVCSIRCPLAMGLIPTLQCHLCLCLYHPECVGLEEAINRTIYSYKCKNCQLTPAKSTSNTKACMNTIPPPPLTPISSLTSVSPSQAQFSPNNPPPKLTRLTDGKVVSVPRTLAKPQVPKTQSIVGGVTTWLPPSSSIQLSPTAPKLSPSFKSNSPAATTTVDTATTLPVQTLIAMNGKRYVVVPKHNVLSVSPTVTAPSISIDPSCQQITTQSEISPLTGQAYGPGGPILPKPTPSSGPTFLVSSPATPTTTFQNPPGVLLVPYLAPPSSPQQTKDGVQQQAAQPQYVIVNGPSGLQAGNFIFGNLPQQQLQLPAIPTSQAAEPPSESAGTKRTAESPDKVTPSKKLKVDDANHMQNFVQNIGIGYKALLQSFQYLKVQELLRAARVCQMWRDIAMHKSLWETVKMKNSRVRDWEGVAHTLRRVGTCHLDLRKMIVPDKSELLRTMWSDFIKCVSKVNTLVKLDLCRCSSTVLEQVATACPQLEYLNAISIRNNELNFTAIGGCKNMTELRLKSISGMDVSNVAILKTLTKLKYLSLTSVRNLPPEFPEVLNKLVLLETLELGECTDLPEKFVTESLPAMTRLRRLRLEKGQGSECPTVLLLETISRCPTITQLELINFDVKPGFDTALALCTNIKSFLIIPTYVTQSATTNHVIIEGVSKLSKTLTYFVWGLTLELLRVTDLFIDQWEGQKNNSKSNTPHKKGTNDCIPILKPEKDNDKNKDGSAPLQVDVLQLSKLHKVLMTLLPTTQIKILKVPFSATWRQTIPGTSQ